MPGGLGFRCADAGQQVLLPQEPLAVGRTQTQLDGTGIVRTAAGDKQLHVALLLSGYMIAFDRDRVRLCRRIIVVRSRTYKVGEGQVGLAVTETVVDEGNLLSVQRTGSPQPIQHLGTDVLVGCIGAERKNRKSRRFEGSVKACFRKRLKLLKAFRKRLEGKCLLLVSDRFCRGGHRLLCRVFKFVKNTHFLLSSKKYISVGAAPPV